MNSLAPTICDHILYAFAQVQPFSWFFTAQEFWFLHTVENPQWRSVTSELCYMGWRIEAQPWP